MTSQNSGSKGIERPYGIKHTFFFDDKGTFSEEAMLEEVCRLTGLGLEQLKEISSGKRRLTKDEYDLMARCPANLVPNEVLLASVDSIRTIFNSRVDVGFCSEERWAELKNSNWELVEEDDVLLKAHNIMKAFTRIRPRRLLQAISRAGWNPGLETLARKCYRSNFSAFRFVNTIIFYLCGTELQRNELEYLLNNGGYAMNTKEWIAATKKHHAMVKVLRVCMTTSFQLTSVQMSELLYFPSLAGRDHYIDEEASAAQIESRLNPRLPYVGLDGKESTIAKAIKERFKRLMNDTEKLKLPATWDDFINRLYLKLSSGSCSKRGLGKISISDFGGVRGITKIIEKDLRMNKRLRAELKPIRHFSQFGHWYVTAFLKYEVAKNRWLYPAEFEYIVLGLFVLDSVFEAFMSVSGVDLGHDLQGSIATKLDVVNELRAGHVCVNTDGKAFDENHTVADMNIVHEMFKEAVPIEGANTEAYAETMAGFNKYMDSIESRTVVFPKQKDSASERLVELKGSLFSGEQQTSAINTALIGGVAMYVADEMLKLGMCDWTKIFYKGDDLNAFTSHWLSAFIMLKWMENCRVELEPAKDHIENNQCEHERCVVTDTGYHGSLARRVGSMVAAEPQGAPALTFNELLSSTSVNVMSLIARDVKPTMARVVFEAVIMTYLDDDKVPKHLSKLFGVPKANGGFGLWSSGQWYSETHADPPEVETEFIVKPDGVLGKFGKANMTDKMLTLISEQHKIDKALLMEERARMVGDSVLSCIGPSKYSDRRRKNVEENLRRSKTIKLTKLKFVHINGPALELAYSAAVDLWRHLTEPQTLRGSYFKTPREVVLEAISHAGVLNETIAAIAYKTETQAGLYRKLTNRPGQERDSAMIRNLWRKGEDAAILFCKGSLSVVFWKFEDKISPDIAALVQKWAIRAVAESDLSVRLVSRKRLSTKLHYEMLVTEVAKIIWNHNKTLLEKIAF
jgi:hypothetical protein